jgi:hypothetical protein
LAFFVPEALLPPECFPVSGLSGLVTRLEGRNSTVTGPTPHSSCGALYLQPDKFLTLTADGRSPLPLQEAVQALAAASGARCFELLLQMGPVSIRSYIDAKIVTGSFDLFFERVSKLLEFRFELGSPALLRLRIQLYVPCGGDSAISISDTSRYVSIIGCTLDPELILLLIQSHRITMIVLAWYPTGGWRAHVRLPYPSLRLGCHLASTHPRQNPLVKYRWRRVEVADM